MSDPASPPALSLIIPVGARHDDAASLYGEYKAGADALGETYEVIFVLDGPRSDFAAGLRSLLETGERFTVVVLTRAFGEATALMAGFARAAGKIIVTLPAYHQIAATELGKLVGALDDSDVAIGWRTPRAGGYFEALRRWAFHALLSAIIRLRFHDLGCGARAFKRRVLEEIHLYGDQHRFLAILADRQGFRVREVPVRQSAMDVYRGFYAPQDYTRRFLDLFTVFFLVRFTRKPLRFFGMVGVTLFGVGALIILYLVTGRLFFDQPLADRPALLLSSLLVVLGLQLFALGLLGELIIFTHAGSLKDYQVAEIVHFSTDEGVPETGDPGGRQSSHVR
jgi:glycosyltransferase involved in cell wall biosynthesis